MALLLSFPAAAHAAGGVAERRGFPQGVSSETKKDKSREPVGAPATPHEQSGDHDDDGMSRDPDDCNKGCIGGNPG